MSCKNTELISGLLHNTLTESVTKELTDHITGCEQCRAEYDSQYSVHQLLKALPPDKAPAGFETVVMQKIMKLHYAGKGFNPLLAVIPLLVLATAVFGFWLFSNPGVANSSIFTGIDSGLGKVLQTLKAGNSFRFMQTLFFTVVFFLVGSVYLMYERFKTR